MGLHEVGMALLGVTGGLVALTIFVGLGVKVADKLCGSHDDPSATLAGGLLGFLFFLLTTGLIMVVAG
jgi:hypothetical protein